jgi:hypothetical protein
MTEMDAVDSKQQQEIDDLKKRADENREVDHNQYEKINALNVVDARHDTYLGILKAIIMLLAVSTFVNWFVMFYLLNRSPK